MVREESGKEVREEDGGQENDTWINASSEGKNRIDCIPSTYSFQLFFVCEMPHNAMSSKKAVV